MNFHPPLFTCAGVFVIFYTSVCMSRKSRRLSVSCDTVRWWIELKLARCLNQIGQADFSCWSISTSLVLRDPEGLHWGQTCALVRVMMSSNHSPAIKIGLAARQEAFVFYLPDSRRGHLFQCHTDLCRVQLIECSCPFSFAIFAHFFSVPILFLSSISTPLPAPLLPFCHWSLSNLHLKPPFLSFFSKSNSISSALPPPTKLSLRCGPLPDTSPPSSAPRPAPRPGGRAPPDPLPSVSAAPQQIGGMVWDFLGKWVLCPGTSARLRG